MSAAHAGARTAAHAMFVMAWGVSMAAGIAGMIPDGPANAAPVCDMRTEPPGATFCPGASLDTSQVIIRRGAR